MTNVETEARLAHAKIMEVLRALPWDVRREALSMVENNSEFCWHCGFETPGGGRCYCTADE